MIRFLQFSDIHFLFCEDTEDKYIQMRIRFIEDLENVKKNIGAIDYILICGDIACKGNVDEFKNANEFISSISKALEIDSKRPNVYIVPGNHDINRNAYPLTRSAYRRVLLDPKVNDDFLAGVKHNEPETLKVIYAPLSAYNEFAKIYAIDEVSETILLGETKLNFENKKFYWKTTLGKLGDYTVNLYGLNSTLTCDGKEKQHPDETKEEHSTYLPYSAYNIPTYANEINVSMIHHPLNWLINAKEVEQIFDDRFKLQFYGHMHEQSSLSDSVVKVFSGALQPEMDSIQSCPPVYNIFELDVEESNMKVRLESRRWNGTHFVKFEEESKSHMISLLPPNNWSEETKKEAKREPIRIENIMIPIHEINYAFINSKKQQAIIEKLLPGTYDESVSDNTNALLFLKEVKKLGAYEKLWNELKQN